MTGLWVPPTGVSMLRMRASERVVTLPSGERVKVTVDDSGTVTHVERDDSLGVHVRPRAITVRARPKEQ